MAYPYYPNNYYPQVPQQQNNSIIWVNGETGAKAYMVAPNQTVQLWDSEAQVIYLKSADASGMPSIKILDYTIRENTPQKPNISPQSDFATKDDVDFLKREINALKSKLEPPKKGKVSER